MGHHQAESQPGQGNSRLHEHPNGRSWLRGSHRPLHGLPYEGPQGRQEKEPAAYNASVIKPSTENHHHDSTYPVTDQSSTAETNFEEPSGNTR